MAAGNRRPAAVAVPIVKQGRFAVRFGLPDTRGRGVGREPLRFGRIPR